MKKQTNSLKLSKESYQMKQNKAFKRFFWNVLGGNSFRLPFGSKERPFICPAYTIDQINITMIFKKLKGSMSSNFTWYVCTPKQANLLF